VQADGIDRINTQLRRDIIGQDCGHVNGDFFRVQALNIPPMNCGRPPANKLRIAAGETFADNRNCFA
jgi:hypothetical protein